MATRNTLNKNPPIHPGEILRDVFGDAGISASAAASRMRVPANRLTAIMQGRRSITADTALRLARFFGTSAQMWMNLQSNYELDRAEHESAKRIEREVRPLGKAS
jgi:antitoxin HigA-1